MNNTIKDLLLSENHEDNKLGLILVYQKYKHPKRVMEKLLGKDKRSMFKYYNTEFKTSKFSKATKDKTDPHISYSMFAGIVMLILKTPEEMK